MYGFEAEHFGIHIETGEKILRDLGLPLTKSVPAQDGGWSYRHDGSVHNEALELVSPPQELTLSTRQLNRKLLKAIRTLGGEVDASCGLHIHHGLQVQQYKVPGARGPVTRSTPRYEPIDIYYTVEAYCFFQSVINEILPPSRRDAEYCHYISETDLDTLKLVCETRNMKEMAADVQWWDRYKTLNVSSISKHGTLEFRQHSGTLNPDKIVHWIILTQAFLNAGYDKRALPAPVDAPERLNSMLSWLRVPTRTREFYRTRRLVLQAGGDSDEDATMMQDGYSESDNDEEDRCACCPAFVGEGEPCRSNCRCNFCIEERSTYSTTSGDDEDGVRW